MISLRTKVTGVFIVSGLLVSSLSVQAKITLQKSIFITPTYISASSLTVLLAGTATQDSIPDKTFERVEVEASVNTEAWRTNLQKVLLPVIKKASRKGMATGKYVVNVRFLVEKDGSLSDVVALNDPGYGLAEGAVKAVQSGPHWTAGEVNGKKVRSYHTQPITYQISTE